MIADIGHVLLSLLVTLGLFAAADPSAVAATAVVMASVALVLIALRALLAPGAQAQHLTHARRSIDTSTPLPATDPDAPGRERPRAPGFAASAA